MLQRYYCNHPLIKEITACIEWLENFQKNQDQQYWQTIYDKTILDGKTGAAFYLLAPIIALIETKSLITNFKTSKSLLSCATYVTPYLLLAQTYSYMHAYWTTPVDQNALATYTTSLLSGSERKNAERLIKLKCYLKLDDNLSATELKNALIEAKKVAVNKLTFLTGKYQPNSGALFTFFQNGGMDAVKDIFAHLDRMSQEEPAKPERYWPSL